MEKEDIGISSHYIDTLNYVKKATVGVQPYYINVLNEHEIIPWSDWGLTTLVKYIFCGKTLQYKDYMWCNTDDIATLYLYNIERLQRERVYHHTHWHGVKWKVYIAYLI